MSRYGFSKQNEAFNVELCDIYCRYVSFVLPSGGEDLNGDEPDIIIKFKNLLGIDDPDAVAVHMEIGRRIFRQRLETGDREADAEERRVEVAIRDNAQRLYAFKLNLIGQDESE